MIVLYNTSRRTESVPMCITPLLPKHSTIHLKLDLRLPTAVTSAILS